MRLPPTAGAVDGFLGDITLFTTTGRLHARDVELKLPRPAAHGPVSTASAPSAVRKRRTEPAAEEITTGLFMDVHHMEGGVIADDVAGAHQKHVETQETYGVDYKHYWVDEANSKFFCLVEAPDADTAVSETDDSSAGGEPIFGALSRRRSAAATRYRRRGPRWGRARLVSPAS